MTFTRWHHFIAAHRSDCGHPRAVRSLEQGLAILY